MILYTILYVSQFSLSRQKTTDILRYIQRERRIKSTGKKIKYMDEKHSLPAAADPDAVVEGFAASRSAETATVPMLCLYWKNGTHLQTSTLMTLISIENITSTK
jgi:hypothetical protein